MADAWFWFWALLIFPLPVWVIIAYVAALAATDAGRDYLRRRRRYDWADDETLNYDETMKIIDALGPDANVSGPPEEKL